MEEITHGVDKHSALLPPSKGLHKLIFMQRDAETVGNILWKHDDSNDENPYQTEHDVFFDAVVNDKPINNAFYGAKSTMTAIMGRMATYSGQLVTWEDALNSDLNIMPSRYAWDAEPPVLPDENGFYPVPVPGVTQAF